jgi:hypothetical protein
MSMLANPGRQVRTMKTHTTRSARLRLHELESREVPAGNVITVFRGNTLFVLGDAQDNSIILSQPGGAGTLTIAPIGTTQLNGQALPQSGTLPPNLTIELGAGTDSLSFDLGSNPILIQNALTIDYGTAGTGTKTTQTTSAASNNLTVGGNFGIRYASGTVTTVLDNLDVSGGLTVRHAAGDGTLTVDNKDGTGSFSAVDGNVAVTSTQGVSNVTILDTNVGGSMTITNGKARASDNAAGSTRIANANNTALSTIGGNLSISKVSGVNTTGDVVGDVLVKGNATIALGKGTCGATVAAQNATTGPTINGNLKVTASANGAETIHLGAAGTGLTVKKNLTVRSGDRAATITVDDVQVTGATSMYTGAGADLVSIDGAAGDNGSTFTGSFSFGSGPGTDTFGINSGLAAGATTTFNGTFHASLGSGNDALNLATAGLVNFVTKVPTFDGSSGTNIKTVTKGNLLGETPTFRNFI